MSDAFTELSPGVFTSREHPVVVNESLIGWLKQQAELVPKRRARICTHRSNAAPVHEMIIALQNNGYIRPHRHFNKSESMHVIEGRAAIIYFTEKGEPLSVRFLGQGGAGDHFFCRTEGAIYHTVVVLTPSFVFHETVQGPFQPNDTEYAPWAPTEQDTAGIPAFEQRVAGLIEQAARPDCTWAKALIS
jgi:cupin fold WbuC family metalloprotein